ncbi:MAG: MFS transporter [Micromonosporaceae bacterium]
MSPATARRTFALVSALTWLPTALGIATMVLLMQVRGLSLAGVGVAFAAYGITVAILELPTGGLADVIGRRTVLAVSAGVGIAAMLGMAFATSLWQFVALSMLKGVSRALSSGPAEAWYVDTVSRPRVSIAASASERGAERARRRTTDTAGSADETALRQGLAAGHTAGAAALAIGTIAGGVLPLLVPKGHGVLVPLSVPMLLAAVAAGLQLAVVLARMPEPPRAHRPGFGEVLRGVPATIGRGLRLGVRDHMLARVMLSGAALGFSLNAIEMLTPGRLAQLTGDAAAGSTAYAVVAAIGFGAVAVGSALGGVVARLIGGPARTAALGLAVAAVSLGGLAASAGLTGLAGIVAAAAAYTGMFLGLGITNPVRSELMHQRVTGAERATVLSVFSFVLMVGGTGSVPLGALAARWSVAPAWWIAAAVLLGSAALYLGRPARSAGDAVFAGVQVHPAGSQEADQGHPELAGQVHGEGAGR